MIVYEFSKNLSEKVVISIHEYKGKRVINIRVYYRVDDAQGTWKPSKKGISMHIKHLEDLAKGINMAIEEANKIQPLEHDREFSTQFEF